MSSVGSGSSGYSIAVGSQVGLVGYATNWCSPLVFLAHTTHTLILKRKQSRFFSGIYLGTHNNLPKTLLI